MALTFGQPPGNPAALMTDKAVIHVPVKTLLIPLVVTRPPQRTMNWCRVKAGASKYGNICTRV